MTQGILLIATGIEHTKLAYNLIDRLGTTFPITLVSNVAQISIKYNLIRPDAKLSSRELKTRMDLLTPYDQTLYLDVDMIPLGDLSILFDYLGVRKIGMCRDDECTLGGRLTLKHGWLSSYLGQNEIDLMLKYNQGLDYFNSGTIVWETGSIASAFFIHWSREWTRFKRIDQFALCRAISICPNHIIELPKIYNWSYSNAKSLDDARLKGVKILHFWLKAYAKSGQWWSPLFAPSA